MTIASSYMLGGLVNGLVNGLLASFDSADPNRTIDPMVELFLRVVDLASEEAEKIANLPLPELE